MCKESPALLDMEQQRLVKSVISDLDLLRFRIGKIESEIANQKVLNSQFLFEKEKYITLIFKKFGTLFGKM